GSDCISGSCVEGRCCESACDGVCQACSGLGDCNVNPGTDSRCPIIDCPDTTTVCAVYPADSTTNQCAQFGVCRSASGACQPRLAAPNTPCEEVAPGALGRCDGAGNCVDPRVALGTPCSASNQ